MACRKSRRRFSACCLSSRSGRKKKTAPRQQPGPDRDDARTGARPPAREHEQEQRARGQRPSRPQQHLGGQVALERPVDQRQVGPQRAELPALLGAEPGQGALPSRRLTWLSLPGSGWPHGGARGGPRRMRRSAGTG